MNSFSLLQRLNAILENLNVLSLNLSLKILYHPPFQGTGNGRYVYKKKIILTTNVTN